MIQEQGDTSIHERDFVYGCVREIPLNMLVNIFSKLTSIGPNWLAHHDSHTTRMVSTTTSLTTRKHTCSCHMHPILYILIVISTPSLCSGSKRDGDQGSRESVFPLHTAVPHQCQTCVYLTAEAVWFSFLCLYFSILHYFLLSLPLQDAFSLFKKIYHILFYLHAFVCMQTYRHARGGQRQKMASSSAALHFTV